MYRVFLSQKMNQFTYFTLQLCKTEWHDKDVLDFGGNIGNMLRDPNSTLDEARFTCIDVCQESTEKGKRYFPKSHWHFFLILTACQV